MLPQRPCYSSSLWPLSAVKKLTRRRKLPSRRTGIGTHEQGSSHGVNSTEEDLDEDEYYSRDEGSYPDADTCLEERDTLDMPPRLANSPERCVVLTTVDATYPSSELGPSPPAADTLQAADEVEGAPQGVEGVPFTLPIDTALPAATIPAPAPLDIVASTTPDLPAASTLASALLDIAAGTTSGLPAVSIPGDALDVGHQIGSASKIPAAECLSEKGMSWQDWETSFMAFKAFFDGGVKVLRSIDELLPLCYRFNGYAVFLGAFVYPETIGALRKFMDKYGCFAEATSVTSSFSRGAAFRALGLVLHGMDTMELLDITDHRLLCWRDAICEAMALGFPVDLLLNLVRDLARAVFGARAIDSMRSLWVLTR
ncbi:hypothetical protein Pyn_11604 [Prunus yedoensis var. nudiflora]|uniref:Uncharacterized protein n=1 Tax=Prunus yedoensis var. nudiflora TaxID=2094558 RepID=A0A314UP40_PRUYE|nr:hypothetical protein Pyn_11604 [Prunus yedoensis var. nudiflora]